MKRFSDKWNMYSDGNSSSKLLQFAEEQITYKTPVHTIEQVFYIYIASIVLKNNRTNKRHLSNLILKSSEV